MGTKETADKNNANFLWKLADKVADALIIRLPVSVETIFAATK